MRIEGSAHTELVCIPCSIYIKSYAVECSVIKMTHWEMIVVSVNQIGYPFV